MGLVEDHAFSFSGPLYDKQRKVPEGHISERESVFASMSDDEVVFHVSTEPKRIEFTLTSTDCD